jgi:NADP-dependent 3-hydroxy acid dehydrogenase YdfG
VTGASSGIGEAISLLLAEEGATVVMGARREDLLKDLCEKINSRGGKACYEVTDVTFRGDLDRLVKFALDEHGRLDAIINNAGVMPLSYVELMDFEGWDSMIDTNFKGVLHGVGAVLPHFLDQGNGHIINISSDAGGKTIPGGAIYSATKAAVNVFSEGLRAELSSRKGIRVTCIQPGATISEIAKSIEDPLVIEERKKSNLDEIRMLLPEDVAHAVCYALCASKRTSINEIVIRPTDQP